MLMAHLGCVYSIMYWFLIKAWHYYNRHFVFNLIKWFPSLVCKLFGYELEIKEKSYIIDMEVLFLMPMLDGCGFIHRSAHNLPRTSEVMQSIVSSWACSRIDLAAHITLPPPYNGVSLELQFSILLLYFKFIFWSNSEKG